MRRAQWILFLDADCRGSADLLDAYFAEPVDPGVGALAGEVVAAASGDSLVARYGAARSFLSQQAHMEHPFRPRAVAANLLVRRDAFEQVGGFYEGVRAAEDTDFSWRLQAAGWRLELRPDAFVVHRYRASLSRAAPAVARVRRRQGLAGAALRGVRARAGGGTGAPAGGPRACPAGPRAGPRAGRATGGGGAARPRRLDRGAYLAIDALLSVEELAGFALSNRPAGGDDHPGAGVVLVADRFPALGDPLVDLARTLAQGARVEAAARPERVAIEVERALPIDYREDDGVAARVRALVWILARHPLRCALDLTAGGPGSRS